MEYVKFWNDVQSTCKRKVSLSIHRHITASNGKRHNITNKRPPNPKPSKEANLKETYLAGTDVRAVRVDLWVVVQERGHRDARGCFDALAGVAGLEDRRRCAVLACLAKAEDLTSIIRQ